MASKWKVGDLVVFNEAGSSNWVGGKGEVVELREGTPYPVTVRTLEVPQPIIDAVDHSSRFIGTDGNFRTENLLTYTEEAPSTQVKEAVDHPDHYGGDTTYEVFKVVEAWGLDEDAYLFNVVKYVARAKKKGKFLEDLKKARVYIDRRIKQLEEAQ